MTFELGFLLFYVLPWAFIFLICIYFNRFKKQGSPDWLSAEKSKVVFSVGLIPGLNLILAAIFFVALCFDILKLVFKFFTKVFD